MEETLQEFKIKFYYVIQAYIVQNTLNKKKSRIRVTLGPLMCDSGVPILYHDS